MIIFSTRNILCVPFSLGFLLCLALPSYSYDLGPVKLHGFVSQGFIISSGNNINARNTTDDGSFDFNELAINGSYQFSESTVFSGQLGSRELGDEGENDLYIDYLQADIQIKDWFGARLGIVKVPLGFYNQTRDIDLARPTVFLPQAIYPESFRPYVENATGGLAYGNIHFDSIGDFDYEIFYGRGSEDDESCLVKSLEVSLDGSDMNMSSQNVYGGSLQYSPIIGGMRFGITMTSGEADFDYTENFTGYNLNSYVGGSFDPITVLSAEYTINDFTFVSEYMYARQRSSLKVGSQLISDDTLAEPQGFFISGVYRVTDKLETALYWESFYPDQNDKDGKDKIAQGLQDHQAWHRAWALAARYDITDWWLIKAEGRIINGTALTSSHYNETDELKQHWETLSFKTTFYF